MNPRPTLYRKTGSPWWWYSWYVNGERILGSCRELGLRIDTHPRPDALAALFAHLGLEPDGALKPEPGQETLKWFAGDIARRLDREGRRPGTIKEYAQSISFLTELLGGGCLLRDIRKRHVGEFQDHLRRRGIRPQTVNKNVSTIQAAFERLVDDEMLAVNPFRRYRRLQDTETRPRALTREQIAALFAAADASGNEAGRRLVRIALFTGLRRTEFLGIARGGIDLSARTITVANVKRRNRPPRTIPMPAATVEHFAWFLKHGAPGDLPLMVCRPDKLSKWVRLWMDDAELPKCLHLHSLRHTFVTLAGEQGVELWRIQKHVDHATIRTTEGYFHPDSGDSIDISVHIPRPKGVHGSK
jgi:integrase/recombinase XerD